MANVATTPMKVPHELIPTEQHLVVLAALWNLHEDGHTYVKLADLCQRLHQQRDPVRAMLNTLAFASPPLVSREDNGMWSLWGEGWQHGQAKFEGTHAWTRVKWAGHDNPYMLKR